MSVSLVGLFCSSPALTSRRVHLTCLTVFLSNWTLFATCRSFVSSRRMYFIGRCFVLHLSFFYPFGFEPMRLIRPSGYAADWVAASNVRGYDHTFRVLTLSRMEWWSVLFWPKNDIKPKPQTYIQIYNIIITAYILYSFDICLFVVLKIFF